MFSADFRGPYLELQCFSWKSVWYDTSSTHEDDLHKILKCPGASKLKNKFVSAASKTENPGFGTMPLCNSHRARHWILPDFLGKSMSMGEFWAPEGRGLLRNVRKSSGSDYESTADRRETSWAIRGPISTRITKLAPARTPVWSTKAAIPVGSHEGVSRNFPQRVYPVPVL